MADEQRTTIRVSSLPDELLVEIFDWCRLDDEYGWNYRRQWYNPLQVCRRWRHSLLAWASNLRLHLLCNVAKPISAFPSHLSSLPLIITLNIYPQVPSYLKQGLLLALQHRDRVSAISISNGSFWMLKDSKLRDALDRAFPILETVCLAEDGPTQELPRGFIAPRFRALHLRNVAIPKGSLLLANVTNLLSLRLEPIIPSDYFTPEYLVERITCMPHLENLSINFYPDSTLPVTMTEFPGTQITRVVLPRLSRLKYIGFSIFLENLASRISAPFLQDFRFTTSLTEVPTLYHLPPFLSTIQNLNLQTAVVSFIKPFVDITYFPDQPSGSVSLPYLNFFVPGYEQAHTAASAVQICSAIAPALPVVENLELRTDQHRLRGSSRVQPAPSGWHALLRSFGGVKTLRVDLPLAMELSDALDQNNGAVIKDLLPKLSELVVLSKKGRVHEPFSSFIHARRLSGHSIDLRVIQYHPTVWQSPRISWSFDTFS